MTDETEYTVGPERPVSPKPASPRPDALSTGALRSRRRSRPVSTARPAGDPLHWWRTRTASSFDDLDLRILVLLLNRYSLSRYGWRDALSGSSADAIALLAGRAFAPADRDLLMTCLLRCALAGNLDARRFLIQLLRRNGLNDLATSWRNVHQGVRGIPLRSTPKTRYRKRMARTPKRKTGCGNRGR